MRTNHVLSSTVSGRGQDKRRRDRRPRLPPMVNFHKNMWQCVAKYGNVWQDVARCGKVRQHDVAKDAHLKQTMATCRGSVALL